MASMQLYPTRFSSRCSQLLQATAAAHLRWQIVDSKAVAQLRQLVELPHCLPRPKLLRLGQRHPLEQLLAGAPYRRSLSSNGSSSSVQPLLSGNDRGDAHPLLSTLGRLYLSASIYVTLMTNSAPPAWSNTDHVKPWHIKLGSTCVGSFPKSTARSELSSK